MKEVGAYKIIKIPTERIYTFVRNNLPRCGGLDHLKLLGPVIVTHVLGEI